MTKLEIKIRDVWEITKERIILEWIEEIKKEEKNNGWERDCEA